MQRSSVASPLAPVWQSEGSASAAAASFVIASFAVASTAVASFGRGVGGGVLSHGGVIAAVTRRLG